MFLFVTCFAPLVVLSSVAFKTRSRIDLTVDHMLALVITAMGKRTFGRIEVFVTWFDLFLVGMAVSTERLLMACRAGEF
jgi:hypothetical protein